MLLRAAREHALDLSASVMIGDSVSDVLAGKAVGAATILLRGGGGDATPADVVVPDLAAGVRLLLSARGGGPLAAPETMGG
jgi:D-glycero-D-manno-heptose 1,7-bisphosphate phosphatase